MGWSSKWRQRFQSVFQVNLAKHWRIPRLGLLLKQIQRTSWFGMWLLLDRFVSVFVLVYEDLCFRLGQHMKEDNSIYVLYSTPAIHLKDLHWNLHILFGIRMVWFQLDEYMWYNWILYSSITVAETQDAEPPNSNLYHICGEGLDAASWRPARKAVECLLKLLFIFFGWIYWFFI